MYLIIGVLFALCILFFIVNYWRREKIRKKLDCMDPCEKIRLLNELAKPFGFIYLPAQDIMSSRTDAWQKEYGYCALYDQCAPRFNMVFDCEPIYFNYKCQTWMIELWKGQYGINTGGEVGIYYADTIVPPEQYDQTLFHGVPANKLMPVSMQLFQKGSQLYAVEHHHWWLTGFCMGHFCEPENLVMRVSITCLDCEMLSCLVTSLLNYGYQECDLCICDLTVSFTFCFPHTKQPRCCHRFQLWLSGWQNHLFCWLFRRITRYYDCTLDRILYLYFFLPFAFRHMLRFKKMKKIARKGKRRRYHHK